ncbi:amidohydrolase family protein [Tractidigestivibacter scatoligenes]|jgi:predicted TIM-barrel fold metal-dependent hydrolase|uniref:amidohydrolase family protein n=1 Tax=Tractidigestivibacter scatoligenes TaxID=1299998 RepID=UPI002F359BF8
MIDIHGHILTKGYLDLLEAHGATREDGFPLPAWNEIDALAFLDEAGIRYQVLSLSSPHPYFGNAEESAAFCRAFNDETARVVARHPNRFGFCAVVPLPDVDTAITEASRAIGDLDALGVKLASNSRGLYLGDERLDPLFYRLESLAEGRGHDVVCLIHPSRPEPIAEGVFSAGPTPLYEFLADTTRAVLNMIAHNVPRRFPHVQIVVPHCGSFLPNVVRRIEGAQSILERAHMMSHVDVPANLARLWFDTAGDPVPDLLPLLLTITSPSHVLFGSDFPFTPNERALANARRLQEFLTSDWRLAAHADDILDNNAQVLLAAAGAHL